MIKHGNTPVSEVILHTSATPKEWQIGKTNRQMFDEIRRWHVKDNGWRDIGYHRVVMPDGEVMIGRSLYVPGAHVAGRNTGTIGICMIGPGTPIGDPLDHYTREQIQATRDYLAELFDFVGKPLIISGHNDHAARDCPGFKVRASDWAPATEAPRPPREDEAAEPPDGCKRRC